MPVSVLTKICMAGSLQAAWQAHWQEVCTFREDWVPQESADSTNKGPGEAA